MEYLSNGLESAWIIIIMWKSFSKFVPQTIPVVNVHGIINRKL